VLADKPAPVFTGAAVTLYLVAIGVMVVGVVLVLVMSQRKPLPPPRRYRRGKEVVGAKDPSDIPLESLSPPERLECERVTIDLGIVQRAIARRSEAGAPWN
jgi:hypothetical protein